MLPEPQATDDTHLTGLHGDKNEPPLNPSTAARLRCPVNFKLVVKVSHIMEQHLFTFLKSDFNLVWWKG